MLHSSVNSPGTYSRNEASQLTTSTTAILGKVMSSHAVSHLSVCLSLSTLDCRDPIEIDRLCHPFRKDYWDYLPHTHKQSWQCSPKEPDLPSSDLISSLLPLCSAMATLPFLISLNTSAYTSISALRLSGPSSWNGVFLSP